MWRKGSSDAFVVRDADGRNVSSPACAGGRFPPHTRPRGGRWAPARIRVQPCRTAAVRRVCANVRLCLADLSGQTVLGARSSRHRGRADRGGLKPRTVCSCQPASTVWQLLDLGMRHVRSVPANSKAKPLAGALVEGYSLRAWSPATPAELPENSPMGITGRLEDKRTEAPARPRIGRPRAPGTSGLVFSETLKQATTRAKPREVRHNLRSELRTGVSQRLAGGAGSLLRTRLCLAFPVFHQRNRETCKEGCPWSSKMAVNFWRNCRCLLWLFPCW
ncbi:hypothetical protein BH23PLA1_BH23PLA1_42680 [soil metagenome]